MINITDEQRKLFVAYIDEKTLNNGINDVLDVLDDKITEIGFYPDYSLNDIGIKLQLLYDQLYNQN